LGSLETNKQITELSCVDNFSYLCSSLSCSNTNGDKKYFCTEPLYSPAKTPIYCYDTDATMCKSTQDSTTQFSLEGRCECAKNAKGDGICTLNPFDAESQHYTT